METLELIQHRAAIAGYVTDAQSGEVIPGAVVQITADNLETETAADGFFYFLDLEPGQYTLGVSAPDRGSLYGTVTVPDVAVQDAANGTPIFDVKANVALQPTMLSGTIRRVSDGQPIPNAEVRVLGGEEKTLSEADGSYVLSPLQAGTPNIKASADNYVAIIQQATLTAGEETIMDFNLEAG